MFRSFLDRMSRSGAAALVALGLAASSCSCGSPTPDRLEPKLEFEGDGVGSDPLAKAHYAIDFGMVAVGSSATPEVFAFNAGTARLTAQVENAEQIPAPFDVGSGSLDIAAKDRRKVEFTMSPREVGAFETIVTFRTNERERVKTVRLFGEGIRSELVCNPAEVNIGDVVKGETRSATTTCTNNLSIPTSITLGSFVGAYQRYFAAEAQGGDGTTVEIAPGGSVDIEISFHADNFAGAAAVTLPILDEAGQTVLSLPVHANALEYALQVRYEEENGERVPLVGCYRFPDTDIEMTEVRSLYVRNLSRNPVHIEQLLLEGESAHYSIVAPELDGPVLVAPNGEDEVEVQIAFHPTSAQKHTEHLVIHSDDDLAPVGGIRACVEGQGGGARISCLPANINFGPVAIGMTVTRDYTCENTAQAREGVPPQVLYLHDVTATDARFDAQIVNPDGTTGPDPLGYHPNEGFTVRVSYTPGPEESFDSAEIVVHNSSSADEFHTTQVFGQGRLLPPCVFDVTPGNLRFGVVAPGDQRTLTSYVVNHLDTQCIISNLRLSLDTDPAFSMEPVETVTLEGGERFPIQVTFAPTEYANSLTGTVQFYISDPMNGEQEIPLTGISQRPCLEFDPKEIDFGSAPPHCAGREVFVSVANTCATTLQIDDIQIDEGLGQFVLHSVPLMPFEIKPGDRKEFSAYFRPDAEGPFEGAIHLEVSDLGDGTEAPRDIGPYVVTMKGQGSHEAIQTDSYTQQDAAKVDVLWVIDNSGSMGGAQTLIHNNVPNFMEFAVEQGIDFHVGVTTSGVAYAPSGGSCPGGFGGNEDGRLFPHPDQGRPRILKSTMPRDQLFDHFRHNIQVGLCHGSEAMYEAARRALSHPWINTPESEGGNQGFLRDDASLSIIGVTDEDDVDTRWDGNAAEDRSVIRYVDFFRSLKPSWRSEEVKIHFISGGETSCSGNGGALACPRCFEGTVETKGVWLEICHDMNDEEAWEDAFREISQGAFGFDSAFGLRGQPGDWSGDGKIDHEDFQVHVNGRPRPAFNTSGARVWRYNPTTTSIVFDVLHVPGANQLIEVTYKVACVNYD